MKVIWEPEDIEGGVKTRNVPGPTGEYIIGYIPILPVVNKWCLIALCDGMIVHTESSKQRLAELLTEGGHKPVCLTDKSEK